MCIARRCWVCPLRRSGTVGGKRLVLWVSDERVRIMLNWRKVSSVHLI